MEQGKQTKKRRNLIPGISMGLIVYAVGFYFFWRSSYGKEFLVGTHEKWFIVPALVGGVIAGAWVVNKVLLGFVAVIAKRTSSTLDDEIVKALHKPITRTLVLFGLWKLSDNLGLAEETVALSHRVFLSLGILSWSLFAFHLSQIVLQAASKDSTKYRVVGARSYPLFDNVSKILIVAGLAYALITVWHIDATGWVASAGILGLAVGFAAKDTLSNLFAGVFILADAPYIVGDFIVLGSGQRGKVVDIGIRSTRILTRDDIEITVPNAIMGNNMVVNETSSRANAIPTRIKVSIGVAYGSDLDQVKELLMEVANENATICKEPSPRVRFRTFGESSLNLQLQCWISDPALKGRTLDALNTAVYKALTAAEIEIPYPKRDVYIHRDAQI